MGEETVLRWIWHVLHNDPVLLQWAQTQHSKPKAATKKKVTEKTAGKSTPKVEKSRKRPARKRREVKKMTIEELIVMMIRKCRLIQWITWSQVNWTSQIFSRGNRAILATQPNNFPASHHPRKDSESKQAALIRSQISGRIVVQSAIKQER